MSSAFGRELASASLQGKDLDQSVSIAEPHPATANLAATKDVDPQQSPAGVNPLWGIPVSSLSATRERPIFSASLRPPAPPAPPPCR